MKRKKIDIPIPVSVQVLKPQSMDPELRKDKILGALVGSAIGDAMGASTEMWDRYRIQNAHGYITGLTTAIREKSPEGTWQRNMIPGATTDDTRWKYFMGEYLGAYSTELSAKNFATFIVTYYESLLDRLQSNEVKQSTDALDAEMEKVNWIKEWARVALAYEKGEAEYAKAQNRFYGGEMSCAGMLYTPVLGLLTESSEEAYTLAFGHGIFDIGYARDISALTAVLTFNAMHLGSVDSVLDISMRVDPYAYMDSRLVGRLSTDLASEARSWVKEKIEMPLIGEGSVLPPPPDAYPGSGEEWYMQSATYERMAAKQKAIAFHAGEIWQILIAGLDYGNGDFMKSMQFIVNYGRDNDTVAAVAGMILGAHIGYADLPVDIRDEVVKVSKEVMGIDLEALASSLHDLH